MVHWIRIRASGATPVEGAAQMSSRASGPSLMHHTLAVTDPSPSSVRVFFVASNAQLGGTELFLDSVLTSLEPEWVDTVLLLGGGPFISRLRASRIAATALPCGRRVGLVACAVRLRRILSSRSPHVVHANGVKAALVTVMAATGTRSPIVWQKQDCARDGWMARMIARRCALVVGVSSAVLETLAGMPGVPTTIIPNAIPRYEVDRREAREALLGMVGAGPNSLLVGQVARLHPGKGQLELVEIAPELRRAVPGLRVVFVGAADPYEPAYEEVVRARVGQLGLKDCVTFLGHRDDAVQITAGCDVLAIPSLPDPVSGWREGFPLSPLEAMAVGTPVAGYAEPAIVEELGPCGELVATGDREGLRETIRELLTDEAKRERLRECGYRRVRDYELPKTVGRLKDAFLGVAADARPALTATEA